MKSYFEDYKIDLNDYQMSQLEKYYNFLVEENEKYNLTAITDKKDVYIKHFLDSMLISNTEIDLNNKNLIDIGIGAGFPSMPIKIMNKSVRITGLDSLNKRISFLNQLRDLLNFESVEFVHGRAEDFGQNKIYREKYDIAVSRAVAELRLLLELVMPFVKVNGYFIAYKSIKNRTELDESKNSLKCMKSELVEIKKIILPEEFGERDLLIIKKNANVDKKYPRKPGIPKKSPL